MSSTTPVSWRAASPATITPRPPHRSGTLRVTGKAVPESVAQILPYLDRPAGEPLTAVLEGVPVPLDPAQFGRRDAARLHLVTEGVLASIR